MTKNGAHGIIKKPDPRGNGQKGNCALRRLAHSLDLMRRGVVWMWKEKVFAILRVLVLMAIVMWLLTTKAC